MDRNIEEVEFCIFDTETTGLDPSGGDRVVEIAAVRFRGRQRLSAFTSLINPRRPVSEAAFAVNHISPEMLEGAPGAEEVLPKFMDFLKGSCACSYNAAFDLAFLNQELKLLNSAFPADIPVVDILKMSRRLLPGLERYALWFVAERLGIKTAQEHRALSDVELSLEVFGRLKAVLEAKHIFDFRNFLSLFSLNSALLDDLNSQKSARIQEAIDLGLKLRIKYLSASSASVSEREVLPKEIKRQNNRGYLVGHCYLRNEERSFRIDGILHIETV